MPRKRLLALVLLAGAAAGLGYVVSGLVYVPDPSRFVVSGELAKTEYRAGEEIIEEPFLTYTGMRRVTISSVRPLLFVEVYTAEDAPILHIPELRQDILQFHTLGPNVPYNEGDRWPYPDYLKTYAFKLEQSGSYKVVVRADFRLDEYPAPESHVYSQPVWIEVTGRDS